MKKLDRHISAAWLLTLAGSVIVSTFVISLTGIFEIVELLARGAPWRSMLRLLLWGLPAALTFSIPLSVLTAGLLVFGKLSADGEIMAMKASGISMWRIMRVPLLISGVLTMLCLAIHSEVAPRAHRAMGEIIAGLGVLSPSETLDEGRFIDDFKGLTIYLGRKNGDRVFNVRVYDVRNPDLKREIMARSGRILGDENGRDLWIDLYDVRIAPFSDQTPDAGFIQRTQLKIENALRLREYRVREQDMSIPELLAAMSGTEFLYPSLDEYDLSKQRMSFIVEFNRRLCLSLACTAFLLLGVPLGTAAHRKESSAGVGISMFLALNFYLFIIIGESLAKHPEASPYLIVWFPVLISVALGSSLVRRVS